MKRWKKYAIIFGMLSAFFVTPQTVSAAESTTEPTTKQLESESAQSGESDYAIIVLLSLSVVTAVGLAISTKKKN